MVILIINRIMKKPNIKPHILAHGRKTHVPFENEGPKSPRLGMPDNMTFGISTLSYQGMSDHIL